MCERAYQAVVEAIHQSPPATMNYEAFVTIVLTALAVMLAAIGIFLAVLAFVGYSSLKTELKQMAEKRIDAAMGEQFAGYPSAAELRDIQAKLNAFTNLLSEFQTEIVNEPEPNIVDAASNTAVQQVQPQEVEAAPATQSNIPAYPGEEVGDARISTADTAPAEPDTRPDHRQTPDQRSG